jgi:hypothetical protein
LKNYLLFNAEKSRDLDFFQGKYKGATIYESFFSAIDLEVKRRKDEAERKRKDSAESLDFDGPAGEPGIPSTQLQEEESTSEDEEEVDEGLYEEMFEEETAK